MKRKPPGRRPQASRQPSRHRGRMLVLQGGLLFGLGLVAWRVAYVQHVFGPRLLQSAHAAEDRTGVLMAARGTLLDRNGNRLAYDEPAYMFDLKTSAFTDKIALAQWLAPILQTSVTNLLPRLSNPQYVWIQWPNPILEPTKEAIIAKLQNVKDKSDTSALQDVTFTPTEQRFYPNGPFAANVLGFVDHNSVGQGGLELEYNKELAGKNGTYTYTEDGEGFPIPTSFHTVSPAVPGDDIQLTLDSTVQGFVEEKLDELVKQYHPDHAAIIVADPRTGQILGLGSRPTFDPNQYWTASPAALSTDWAVNSSFEPGSTFKVVTLIAGLATHAITLSEKFMSGHMMVSGRQINDWNYTGWGILNFRQALEQSSNVGFATIALRVGWNNMLHYMQELGFLDKTGIDLPAEASSDVFPPSEQHQLELATSGFGQGISVTPIQQIAAYGAVANGGKLMRPYLAWKFINATSGKVDKVVQPTVVNPEVAPPSVISQVNQSLVDDVSIGIDSLGAIPGYQVAGKTGTAQIVNPKTGQYYTGRFNVSFIGYAPASNPRIEVYVTLNWPKKAPYEQWGSTIATPAAAAIMKECLEYFHVPQDAPVKQTSNTSSTTVSRTAYVQVPSFVGRQAASTATVANQVNLKIASFGGGSVVKNQWPAPGMEVPAGSKVYLWAPTGSSKKVQIPNLTGTSLREAANILAALGLNMSAQGMGFAVSQSIAPGVSVGKGTKITVTFVQPSHEGQ